MGFVWVRGCLKSLQVFLFYDLRYENMINKSNKVRACFDFANIIGNSNEVSAYVKYLPTYRCNPLLLRSSFIHDSSYLDWHLTYGIQNNTALTKYIMFEQRLFRALVLVL